MAGTIVVDRIESDGSYASTINVASKVNFTGGMQIGGVDASMSGMRNRIINGDMRITQRGTNSISANNVTTNYPADRWMAYGASSSSKFTAQQVITSNVSASNYESGGSPTGFTSSIKITSTSAYTVPSGEFYMLQQVIEGNNISDLAWGTSSAKPITISFWVKSSLTGSFGLSVYGGSGAISYPTLYTINQANTWEKKIIVVPGPTTGTWNIDNTSGVQIVFSLGAAGTMLSTANQWTNSPILGATGQTNIVATNGATFYVTGVQVEKGSVATDYEYRQYSTELQMCQRYFQRYAEAPAAYQGTGLNARNGSIGSFVFPVVMRTSPTATNITGYAMTNATTYAFSSPTVDARPHGLRSIFGISGTSLAYTEPIMIEFTTLDLSAEL